MGVDRVAPSVRELAVQLANHLDDCYSVRLETNKQLQAVTTKLDRIEQLPMKAVRWIASIVVVAAITTITTNYLNSQQAAEKAQQAAMLTAQTQSVVVSKLDRIQAGQAAASNAAQP